MYKQSDYINFKKMKNIFGPFFLIITGLIAATFVTETCQAQPLGVDVSIQSVTDPAIRVSIERAQASPSIQRTHPFVKDSLNPEARPLGTFSSCPFVNNDGYVGNATGTNLQYGAHVVWPNGPGTDSLQTMYLTIVGTINKQPFSQRLVMHDFGANGPANQKYWEFSVRIDTTKFDNGTKLTLYNDVTSQQGSCGEDIYYYNVYNMLYDVGNNGFDGPRYGYAISTSVKIVRDDMHNQAHYFVRDTMSHHKQTILGLIPQFTAFYINSHGSDQAFGDSYAGIDSPDSNYIYFDTEKTKPSLTFELSQSIQQKTSAPPYNWVYTDTCLTGTNWEAAAWLSGSSDGVIPGSGSDRAYMGWSQSVDEYGAAAFLYVLIKKLLTQGEPLKQAVQEAAARTQPWVNVGTENYQNWIPGTPTVFGDLQMTLHGLYNYPKQYAYQKWYNTDYDGVDPNPIPGH